MKKEIKVSGHLEVIKGVYHMKLSWVSAEGKRQRKSKSTELPVRGNKKKAQDMLIDFQREQEAKLVAMAVAFGNRYALASCLRFDPFLGGIRLIFLI